MMLHQEDSSSQPECNTFSIVAQKNYHRVHLAECYIKEHRLYEIKVSGQRRKHLSINRSPRRSKT